MNNQRKIVSSLDYCLESLKDIKKMLMDYGHPNKEINWAIGGLISTLVSQLLKACDETFSEAINSNEANAKQELLTIQSKFNAVIQRMVNYE